jgi:hypothetical protein
VWRCHKCYRVYHLGVTRRCLEDGHVFCTLLGKARQTCTVEFDYTAWAKFNIWRREHARKRKERDKSDRCKIDLGQKDDVPSALDDHSVCGGITPTKHLSGFLESEEQDWPIFKEWNCWLECNFPSECHGFRQWQAREKRNLSRISGWKPVIDEQMLEEEELRTEAEAQLQREFMEGEDSSEDSDSSSCYSDAEDFLNDESIVEVADTVQPLSHPIFDLGKKRLSGLILTENEPSYLKNTQKDVQIRDGDGLDEESHRHEYIYSKRRRSVEVITLGETPSACLSIGSPPSSPLKSEWDVGEVTTLVEEEKWEDVGLDDQARDKYEARYKEWMRGADHERISDWAHSAGIEASEAPESPETIERNKIGGPFESALETPEELLKRETDGWDIKICDEMEEKRRKELDDSRNREIMESLRARSMFLRTFKVEGGEERFGDEADTYF